MSIPVDVADLSQKLTEFDRAYLLTSLDGRVKAVSVRVHSDGGTLHVLRPGGGSVANVGANPFVTLLFPPREGADLTLLVDGTAVAEDGDVRVTPTGAVLHKPAA
jgi:hypothetical protein